MDLGSGRVTAVDVHRHCAATRTADDDIGMMLIVLGLSDADGGVEIVVGKGWIQHFVAMAMVTEEGRLQAAQCRLPAVEEEDVHGTCGLGWLRFSMLLQQIRYLLTLC